MSDNTSVVREMSMKNKLDTAKNSSSMPPTNRINTEKRHHEYNHDSAPNLMQGSPKLKENTSSLPSVGKSLHGV